MVLEVIINKDYKSTEELDREALMAKEKYGVASDEYQSALYKVYERYRSDRRAKRQRELIKKVHDSRWPKNEQ